MKFWIQGFYFPFFVHRTGDHHKGAVLFLEYFFDCSLKIALYLKGVFSWSMVFTWLDLPYDMVFCFVLFISVAYS